MVVEGCRSYIPHRIVVVTVVCTEFELSRPVNARARRIAMNVASAPDAVNRSGPHTG